jgi:hypothetical protein
VRGGWGEETRGGAVVDGAEDVACFLNFVYTERSEVEAHYREFSLAPDLRDRRRSALRSKRATVHDRKGLQRSFAGSVVQLELGSVMLVAVSLPLSGTAAHLLQIHHEEPMPYALYAETREHVHSRI